MDKIKALPKYIWILVGIILVSIFLRTYNFHDWLRFNPDQSRDAAVMSKVLQGETDWPALGPKAGGTNFKLGPMFYDFQIVAGKIFGDRPAVAAYPDLLFSILAIPLLFFLMRKYFSANLALTLAVIYGFSYYAIRYARFAWNPNGTPFWTMLFLYALLEIFDTKELPFDSLRSLRIKKFLWSVVAGVAVGVGMQLHTFLLVGLPLITILTFGYVAWQERKILKYFLVVLVVALLMNTTQLVNEVRTGGENLQAFFGGVGVKKEKTTWLAKITHAGQCGVVANTYILSSAGGSDDCNLLTGKSSLGWPVGVASVLFVLGGWGLAIWGVVTESDPGRKRFLGLFLAYNGLLALLFVPVASEISMRFYLILLFAPFVFLGLWLELLVKKLGWEKILLAVVLAFLLSMNVVTLRQEWQTLTGYAQGRPGDFDIVYLGELERVADFLVANAAGAKELSLDGNKAILFKTAKSLNYLTERSGVSVQQESKKNIASGETLFYLVSIRSLNSAEEDLLAEFTLERKEALGRFAVLQLRRK